MLGRRVLMVAALLSAWPAGAQEGGVFDQLIRRTGPTLMPLQRPLPVLGKGVISGTVVDAQTHEPIKKATVSLQGSANLNAVTDPSGNFTFRALPPGAYFLNANKEGYFQDPLGGIQSQVSLNDGEENHGMKVKLEPGSSISGKIVDEDGEPVNGCFVSATRKQNSGALNQVNYVAQATTDEQGVYRLRGFPHGRYRVQTQCQEVFPAPHGFMRRDDPDIPLEGFESRAYAPPAQDREPDASELAVPRGQELSGIDFHLKRIALFTVRVTLSGPRAENANLALVGPDELFQVGIGPTGRAANEFAVHTVPTGVYTVTATVIDEQSVFEARQDVEVGKSKEVSVALTMSPGPRLKGLVEFDDPTRIPQGTPASQDTVVTLNPLDPSRGISRQAPVKGDGHFELTAPSGLYSLIWTGGSYIKEMTVDGQPASPADFELSASAAAIHIVIGTKPGKIDVSTGARSGENLMLSALLIPEIPQSYLQNIGQTNEDGHIVFASVPPGKYKLAVLPTQNPGFSTPEVSKCFAAYGTPIEVPENGDLHITVKPISTEDFQKALEAEDQP